MTKVGYNRENGGVDYIINDADEFKMNWANGAATWGLIENAKVKDVSINGNEAIARYETDHLDIVVTRRLEGEVLREKYVFTDKLNADVFLGRGAVGIYATFNDSYDKTSICLNERCHTHIWCGGNTSYVNAVKMGVCDFALALVLTEGSLDTYSVRRDLSQWSNDRGDFIFHPDPVRLLPGQSFSVAWDVFFYNEGEFTNRIAAYSSVILVETENYTVFENEKIEFSVNRENAVITLDGERVDSVSANGRTFVSYKPERIGHHSFELEADGVKTKAEFFVQIDFKTLARRRAEFIAEKQQYNCPGSALDGAYLIHDGEDDLPVFDNLFPDYNASRERLVMGLFMAKYLQYDRDPGLYESLMKYYRFVTREFYDEETGEVYNTIGKDPSFKRLYNAPWMSLFTLEMYNLTGDEKYLDKMFTLLSVYYSIGGEKFYPNGISMYETVAALKKAGKTDKAAALTEMYERHVAEIIKKGTDYPEHEVRYEQTIVSPAAMLTAQMYMLKKDPALIDECRKQIKVLERFNGRQPSHYMNDMAIRHWDAYWFGKRKLYGDTFPHTASVHTSNAFLHYYYISGDEEYKKRAVCGARNNFSLFEADGSAHCTRLHPFRVNGERGEYYDPFMNEQDGFLYFYIKYYGGLD